MKKIFSLINYFAAIVFVVVAAAQSGCSEKSGKTSGNPVPIARLDKDLAEFATLDSVSRRSMYSRDSVLVAAQMQVMGVDTVGFDYVELFAESGTVSMFAPEVASLYPDLKAEEQALGNILIRAREQGISLPERKYAATVWGLPRSIVVNGNVVIIALNHYLGPEHPAYEGWPEYRRAMKRRDMLPYDLAEALIAIERPYIPSGLPTVLSRMLYEGALVYAKMTLSEDESLSKSLGFSDSQLADVQKNESFIWERLLDGDMLHSSDPAVIEGLFSLSPVSTLISPDAPGRAARLVGYNMIRSWLKKNPDARLDDLLSPKFYDNPATLSAADYMPAR